MVASPVVTSRHPFSSLLPSKARLVASTTVMVSPLKQGKSSELTSRVMRVPLSPLEHIRRATRSYFASSMLVMVKISSKRVESPVAAIMWWWAGLGFDVAGLVFVGF